MNGDTLDILLLCGSPAARSRTHGLMRLVAAMLLERGVRPALWCLRERPLPPVEPEYHADPGRHPDERVRTFVETVRVADGIVLGTPLYHGSYSSTLKTALDNLGYDAFRRKPVALVSNAGGARNCTQACEHLRPVVRTLFGYTTQCQIGTSRGDYAETADGYRVTNDEIKRRCAVLADEIVELAALLGRPDAGATGAGGAAVRSRASGAS